MREGGVQGGENTGGGGRKTELDLSELKKENKSKLTSNLYYQKTG